MAMCNPTQMFLINCVSKMMVLFWNEITTYWVKVSWLAEPVLLTSTLLLETMPGDSGKAG